MLHISNNYWTIISIPMQTQQESLTDAVYVQGGTCSCAEVAIRKIKETQDKCGVGKYINFMSMPLSDLLKVQQAFPDHEITQTAAPGWCTYYEVKPKSVV